jgi:hypothetical protein
VSILIGLGYKLDFDPDLIVPDSLASIWKAQYWHGESWMQSSKADSQYVKNLARAYNFSLSMHGISFTIS